MSTLKPLLMTGVLMLAWLPIHYGAVSAESPAVSPSDANTAGYNSSDLRPSAGLSWAPPALVDPVTIVVSNSTRRPLNLDTTRDYIITLAEPLNGGLSLNGGHNIVLIGGEINIPWQGDGASSQARRMLKVQGATGIVHIEGLLGHGEDISEGIQIAAPQAIIQIQNVRIENVHARDEQGFTDNHPDLIQPWGSYRELRVDRFTGYSDYQGIFLKCDYDCPAGPAIIRNTNLVGLPTARYLWWVEYTDGHAVGPVTLENVWIDVPDQRSGGLGRAVWPDINTGYFGARAAQIGIDGGGRPYATWPGMVPSVSGRVNEGLPPNGDMVPAGTVGAGYSSPGYGAAQNVPAPAPQTSPVPVSGVFDAYEGTAPMGIVYNPHQGDFNRVRIRECAYTQGALAAPRFQCRWVTGTIQVNYGPESQAYDSYLASDDAFIVSFLWQDREGIVWAGAFGADRNLDGSPDSIIAVAHCNNNYSYLDFYAAERTGTSLLSDFYRLLRQGALPAPEKCFVP